MVSAIETLLLFATEQGRVVWICFSILMEQGVMEPGVMSPQLEGVEEGEKRVFSEIGDFFCC